MKQGIITKAAATAANESDSKGLARVCPSGGMVVADKAYCTKEAQKTMKTKGCHSGAIMKNNMKGKNKDKDAFLTRLRSPYENVFSKTQKRSRYRGIKKNQFQVFMEALAFNFKRLIAINAPPLFA
jgi:transposase, IS5 family